MSDLPMTVKGILEAMPQYANLDAIQSVNKTVQFNVTGEESGSYYLRVQNGTVTTHEGTAEDADVTIETPSDVWVQIAKGDLNGAVAFMTGKFRATGDISLLMSMQNWFNMPT